MTSSADRHWSADLSASGHYWSVDLPGLTKEQAEALVQLASTFGNIEGASSADPNRHFSCIFDIDSMESLLQVLRDPESHPLSREQWIDMAQFWLDGTPPETDDWVIPGFRHPEQVGLGDRWLVRARERPRQAHRRRGVRQPSRP